MFEKSALSSELKQSMIDKKIWVKSCPVSLERLSLLKLSYIDFAGKTHNNGKMVVMDTISDNVINIFKELLEIKFPLNSIKLIDEYNGNDDLSMSDNNCSAFNHRDIAGTNMLSIHSYGLAIDINPEINPYIIFDKHKHGHAEIHPKYSTAYINRHVKHPGMVEPIVDIFKKNGFYVWGGLWTDPIDLHHFQPSRLIVQILAAMTKDHAKEFFQITIDHADLINKLPIKDYDNIISKYHDSADNFNKRLEKFITNTEKDLNINSF